MSMRKCGKHYVVDLNVKLNKYLLYGFKFVNFNQKLYRKLNYKMKTSTGCIKKSNPNLACHCALIGWVCERIFCIVMKSKVLAVE